MIVPVAVSAGFLIGSLPTGYLMGRLLKGVDIRTVGSGNVGATNVFRTVGRGAGGLTLLIDVVKGFAPVMFFAPYGDLVPVLTGLAAVAGHGWSPWIGFRGGKGVATSAGVFLALLPAPMGWAFLAFAAFFLAFRRVSIGSLAAAVALPTAAALRGAPRPALALAVVLGVFVFVKHIPNIRRLLRGEEPPVSFSSKSKGTGS